MTRLVRVVLDLQICIVQLLFRGFSVVGWWRVRIVRVGTFGNVPRGIISRVRLVSIGLN